MSHHSFGGFDDEIAIAANVLVTSWWDLLSAKEPWRDMLPDDALGTMRRILSELLNEGRDSMREERFARMTLAAREHGAFRHAQRCSARSVFEEFAFVLDAAELVLAENGHSDDFIADTIVVLESDVEVALEAALDGWMRNLAHRSSG